MKLISCYIENFGLLHGTNFNFSKGLNCCISDNGTGKTTLTAFIESMLYGIGDTRKQAIDDNPRKKYMPWQGGKFGGSLTIQAGKKKYVIERSFGAKSADDTFRLIDADSGRVSEDYGEDIGEKLFGIDRDGFLRTAFLSEKNIQGKNDNKSISAKLSDLVGVDGDVGGFDDALKLLEERRKFYFKKGNTGEIANVKERINECQRKIDAISELETQMAEKEDALRAINAEKQRLKALEDEHKAKLEVISKQREKSAHEERYATMLETVNKEKARLEDTKKFFAAGIPSSEAIDKARDAQLEAERLKAEALAESGNEEYVMLGEFFKNGTDFAEIAEIEHAAELAEEKAREIIAIDNGADEFSLKMRKLFRGNAPQREEIEALEKSANSGFSPIKIISILIGVGILIGGVIIGNLLGYIAAAVGAIIVAASFFLFKNTAKSKELLSFIHKYTDDDDGDAKECLGKIKSSLEAYESFASAKAAKREALSNERSTLTLKVTSFLERFPTIHTDTPIMAVRSIKHKYSQYYALGQAGESSANGKLEKLKRSETLSNAVRNFMKNFPTVTDNPFAEIREKLNDYNYLKTSISRLEADCDEYAVKYGVTGKNLSSTMEDEAVTKAAISELGEKTRVLAANTALVEREINIARAEIEKKEEYEMAKAELEELYQKHVDSLEVIKKTALYLKESCDNITSKYLGKTKEKFEEYSKLITGADGEYTLNTSFELMRTERGEAHGIESYSRGTRDLYSLALRLALIDALYENESPFIIMDDPFIALDDAKLERAKNMLKSIGKTKQILYFTCATSRTIE